MKTAVVILNWNGRKFLEKFLPGLVVSVERRNEAADLAEGATADRSEVIVADNDSKDDSLQWLAENFPGIRTIVLDRNYGFTGGYNRALRQIKAEYYLLINSDIEVEAGWLEPLEEWMDAHPECGACAPKLLSYGDRTMFEYAGAAGGLIDRYGYPFCRGRVPGRTERDEGQYDTPADVFWVSGACLMVRSEPFSRLRGFDERFFAHQEEIDLCWRLQLEGYRVTVVPRSRVYHVGGGTLPNDSPWKLELNFRNNLLMLDNNLARTFALEYFAGHAAELTDASDHAENAAGRDAVTALKEKAERHGRRKAGRTIFTRMVLDGCSAAAYLLTFRPKCFAAVVRGHRQFRHLRDRVDLRSTVYGGGAAENNLSGEANIFREADISRKAGTRIPKGMFGGWIVAQAFFRGGNIFSYLRQRMKIYSDI